jgi:hypothetical protein
MIELAAAATLLGFGWILSQRSDQSQAGAYDKQRVEQFLNSIPNCERPSPDTIYESKRYHHARMSEERRGKESFEKARHPKKTGVISRLYRDENDAAKQRNQSSIRSDLAGIEMNMNHNNMQPFFGSRIKQNVNTTTNRSVLENFTGIEDPGIRHTKREMGPLFKMRPNPEGVYGNPVRNDRHMERFQKSRIRNNETPFDKVYVGPGLNQPGYGSAPANGYNQLGLDNSFVMPRTVDDLRVGNRKRSTYSPPIVPGKGIDQRGQTGKFYQNRPNLTEHRTGNERLFVNAAGNEAASMRPKHIDAKETGRQSMPGYEPGIASGPKEIVHTSTEGFKESDKQQLEDFGFRNLFSFDGMGEEFDHGRENMSLPAQERDVTSEATYQGNVATLVKAIIAPLLDMVRESKKEYDTDHARTFGQVQSQVPMMTVKDPNDIARTTIKETLVQDTHEGYISTPVTMPYVYDPDEVAKTTIRDTLESATANHPGNIQTMQRGDGYTTANVEAKTTLKEGLVDYDYFGGALSIDKQPMSYDEFFNADINVLKEGTLKGRAPVYQGDKMFVTSDELGDINTKKLALDEQPERMFTNYERYPGRGRMQPCDEIHTTKDKMQLPDASLAYRNLDTTVLSSLESNPFVLKPLSSVV